MAKNIPRGNTVYLSFTFKDENGDVASVDSAEVQLYYAGRSDYCTETLTLTESGGVWNATWDSTKARQGWIRWHAHALSGSGAAQYAQDGQFKLTANLASYQHDVLPTTGAGLADPLPEDYT